MDLERKEYIPFEREHWEHSRIKIEHWVSFKSIGSFIFTKRKFRKRT